MSNQNKAYNQLAQRGGLSAGQRERLAMQGQRQNLQSTQQIKNQGLQNRFQIGMQDEQTKNQFLSQLPGLDLQKANFDQSQRAYQNQASQYDIGNALKDVGGLNAYNAGAYSDAMKEWGATKSAEAQANASSGGKK
jgi:hypothetical protein